MDLEKSLKSGLEGESGAEDSVKNENVPDGQPEPAEMKPPLYREKEDIVSAEQILTEVKSFKDEIESMRLIIEEMEEEVRAGRISLSGVLGSKIEVLQGKIETLISERDIEKESAVSRELEERLAALEEAVQSIGAKQDRNNGNLVQTLRENANFQVQVRQGMQKELEELRQEQKGEKFNLILKEIADIYCSYQRILDDSTLSDNVRKTLGSLFEQMEDLLTDYDAEIIRSREGEIRNPRNARLIEKLPTGNRMKHNTVVRSRRPGVIRGRTVLASEFIDVYVYDPSMAPEESDERPEAVSGQEEDGPVCENGMSEDPKTTEEDNTVE